MNRVLELMLENYTNGCQTYTFIMIITTVSVTSVGLAYPAIVFNIQAP